MLPLLRQNAQITPHGAQVRFPSARTGTPARQLGWRLVFGAFLVVAITVLTYFGREGFTDSSDDSIDLLDSLYYATVAITTTGYGDIVPVSDTARAVTTFLVTPARVLFLVLLVGTSVELIASATHTGFRRRTWRHRVKDHIVICGLGVKGRAALQSLHEQGIAKDRIVVVDRDQDAVATAVARGHVGIVGDITSNGVLREAAVEKATTVVVAPNRDDTAVLTTLSVRSLNAGAHLIASVRELENTPLLRRSGADVVLSSAGSTGRMLGIATSSPNVVSVIEDLLEVGRGTDLVERRVQAHEAGQLSDVAKPDELIVAVFRDGEVIARSPRGTQELREGDDVVSLVHAEGQAGKLAHAGRHSRNGR